MEAAFVSGTGTESGQIITTTMVGKNGQPKQVISVFFYIVLIYLLI